MKTLTTIAAAVLASLVFAAGSSADEHSTESLRGDFAVLVPASGAVQAAGLQPGVHVTPAGFFGRYGSLFGLAGGDRMVAYGTGKDMAGLTFTRYRQEHLGLPVFGGEVVLADRDGQVAYVFGRGVPALPSSFLYASFCMTSRSSAVRSGMLRWSFQICAGLARPVRDGHASLFQSEERMSAFAPWECLLDFDADRDRGRSSCLNDMPFEDRRVPGGAGSSVDPQCLVHAGHEKEHADPAGDIAFLSV